MLKFMLKKPPKKTLKHKLSIKYSFDTLNWEDMLDWELYPIIKIIAWLRITLNLSISLK